MTKGAVEVSSMRRSVKQPEDDKSEYGVALKLFPMMAPMLQYSLLFFCAKKRQLTQFGNYQRSWNRIEGKN